MTDRAALQDAVKIFKALADPTRYRIVLMLLERGELGCGDLARQFPITRSAMSHHYRILENAGLLSTKKKGSQVFFRLDQERLGLLVPLLARRRSARKPTTSTTSRRR
jgi:DNA-binding transcriptional ArsR family regulator